jgi:prepilin-type N-terminal cleavage/methylation domain-containing protein
MGRPSGAGERLRRERDGFTLVELLVATALALMVLGSAVTVFTAAIQSQPPLADRGSDIQHARTGMERMTHEIRQAWDAPVATSNQLSILTYVKSSVCGGASATTSIQCRVTYTCSVGTCSRVEALTNGAAPGPAEKIVTGLSSSAVFSYFPSAAAAAEVRLLLTFTADSGDDAITLQDTATFRNPEVVAP